MSRNLGCPVLFARGVAAGLPDNMFDAESLAKGARVEREHTDCPVAARKIAKDHLAEFPDYYERLEAMERDAREHWTPERITHHWRSRGLRV